MARPNAMRSIAGEANLAERVRMEREARGWSYEALAKRMTAVGCSIQGSAIYKVEKGHPPRRITVDELLALSQVFGKDVDDLLTPVEVLRKRRGKEVVREIEAANRALGEACARYANGYVQYFELATYDDELREYVHNQHFTTDAGEATVDSVRLMAASLDDGTEVELDSARLKKALLELAMALAQVAGDAVMKNIESGKLDDGLRSRGRASGKRPEED